MKNLTETASKTYWFHIQPYVHISRKKERFLLYNTLTKKTIEVNDNEHTGRVIKSLMTPRNLRVIKLTEQEINEKELKDFIGNIRNAFMGDLLDTNWSAQKPVQISPVLKLQSDIERVKTARMENQENHFLGEEIMTHLTEFNLYINNDVTDPGDMLLKDAYKQFPYTWTNGRKKEELEIRLMEKLLQETAGDSLNSINILGGNIFKHSNFKELLDVLDTSYAERTYYVHYLDILNADPGKIELLGAKLKGNKRNKLNILVHMKDDIPKLEPVIQTIKRYTDSFEFIFAVRNEKEATLFEETMTGNEIYRFHFYPYYDGSNINFFKKHVFLTKEDILEAAPGQKDIFVRMKVNHLNHGKLSILSNGDIYANVNNPRLGRLGKDSIYDVVFKEMYHGKSWRRTRNKINPCKSCTFQYLCPPVSNYEYVIGRNNLCHVP